MQQTFRMEQSDMLGYNALYTGSYRRIGEGYCLHLRTGLQLQYCYMHVTTGVTHTYMHIQVGTHLYKVS